MSEAFWRESFKRLRAIAQTGRTYTRDPYDLERYEELETLALKLLARLLDVQPEAIRRVYLPAEGYPTPKVDVRGAVFSDDRILLVRETSDGGWTLPGGWADETDSPGAGIEREVKEESGYDVVARRLVAVKDRHLHPYTPARLERIYKLFFLCDLTGGGATGSLETDGAEFFALDRLPRLSLGRTLPADIELMDRYRREPDLDCYFD